MKENYIKLTDEEIEEAKSVDIVDYLLSKGYSLKKVGNKYLLEPHSSLVVFPNTNSWFYYKENTGGNIINFLQKYENKSFQEAVTELIGKATPTERKYTKYVSVPIEKGKLILPKKSTNTNKVFKYLTQNRGIDKDIVSELLKNGDIYQTEDYGSIVFLSKDNKDDVRYACVRSTYENSSFKQDVKNSNKDYGFKTVGKSDKLFVFEAPIDLLSHATISKMQGKDWHYDNRIALGGISDNALNKFLEENPHIKKIILFLDNDETGLKNAEKIAQKYGNDYNIKIFTSSKGKDLNETLTTYKKEKKSNESLKINSFVRELEKPFIPPKFNENISHIDILNKFKEHFTDEINLKSFLKNKLIEIKQNNDDKISILLKEDNKFKVIKSVFEFDLDNIFKKVDILKGSKENYLYLENIDDDFIDKSLVFTDNVLVYIFFKEKIKDFHMVLTDNLDVENIKHIKNILPNYNNIGIMHSSIDTFNNLKNENNLEQILDVKSAWNENFTDSLEIFLNHKVEQKKQIKKSLSEKIADKKEEISKINVLNEQNNKVNINISLK